MSEEACDLSAARAGNVEAFARLYERHAGVVLSLCRRHSSLNEAEDAMQETFLRAFRRLDQLRHASGFRSWLYAIARRVCSERRRAAGRRNKHETRAAQICLQQESDVVTSVEAVDQTEQLERLNIALDALPENERLAIHLHYLDPEPAQAATEVLGLSRSGYYKLLKRARKRLANRMRQAQPI